MRYPNLRYGNPTEMAYYCMGLPLADVARRLRRDERTVRDWLNARAKVPWWVPEILRLQRMEYELRHRQMGMGTLPPMLGIVKADVVTLHPVPAVAPDPRPVDMPAPAAQIA